MLSLFQENMYVAAHIAVPLGKYLAEQKGDGDTKAMTEFYQYPYGTS